HGGKCRVGWFSAGLFAGRDWSGLGVTRHSIQFKRGPGRPAAKEQQHPAEAADLVTRKQMVPGTFTQAWKSPAKARFRWPLTRAVWERAGAAVQRAGGHG